MAFSKITLNGVTLMDVTQDTVTATNLLDGYIATAADGSRYEGTIATKGESDLTASGSKVTVPSGYYATAASKAVAAGTATTPTTSITTTPTITVGSTGLITATVSSSKSITPTVSAGYISSGTAGTVTASGSNTSQLSTQAAATITPTESVQTAVASGKYTTGVVSVGAISSNYVGSNIPQNDSSDLTASGSKVTVPSGYYAATASKAIAAGSATTPATTITANPGITVSASGLITATNSKTQNVTPTVTAGYVSSGTSGTITVNGSNTSQLSTQAAATITPTESSQTAVAAGKYTTGAVTVAAISSNYIGSNIATRSAADLTASGPTVTVPSGYYAVAASKAIASASCYEGVLVPANPTIIVSNTGNIVSTVSSSLSGELVVTPGYISSIDFTGYAEGSASYQLSTQAAQTITPGITNQTIASGKYLTGTQTILGDANLVAENIAKDITIFGVTGTHEGGISAYAYVIVEYPSDAVSVTCTNTDGAIDLSSTMRMFLVSDNTTSCTVTISKTNNTVSKTVTIASGESYYVLMMFMHRFVYNGVIQGSDMTRTGLKDETANYNQAPTVTYATGYVEILAGGSGTYNGAGIAYFPEKMDLTKYSTIHVQGTARNNSGQNYFCAVDAWTEIGSNQAENRLLRTSILSSSTSSYTSFDITADVSTYTSEAYIGFNVRRSGSGYSCIRITEAWID